MSPFEHSFCNKKKFLYYGTPRWTFSGCLAFTYCLTFYFFFPKWHESKTTEIWEPTKSMGPHEPERLKYMKSQQRVWSQTSLNDCNMTTEKEHGATRVWTTTTVLSLSLSLSQSPECLATAQGFVPDGSSTRSISKYSPTPECVLRLRNTPGQKKR